MIQRVIAIVLLLVSLPFVQVFSYTPLSSAERILSLTDQLDENLKKQDELIKSLETNNEEQLKQLRQLEDSLRKQIALSQNLGWLIEDSQTYQRQLERKHKFWQITSGVLAGLCIATTIWALTK